MLRLVCATFLCTALAAQQPTAQPKAEETPEQTVIRTTVQYVTTPVWVFDRDGDYVNGLQPSQFRLFDNDKEQQIQVDVSFTPISLVICVQANSHVQGLLPQGPKDR